ncbi:hypothetical protein ACTU45_24425 [Streptomyces sp. 24-1644]|uniref:hypothetical protein n=1 Tax=Streptomyces sp. 24-1644 TaxID=3457315 RepID=UPI003FA682DC
MANTRKLDREIAIVQDKLQRVRSQDSTALSVGDQAKLAGLTGYAVAKAVHRMKSARGAERTASGIWARAEERLAADLQVLQSERQQLVVAEAAARREKKKSGWW